LPAEWEGRDVQVVGVVAALPHAFERGERFAFVVESVETAGARVPRRIMLSWYHGWLEDEWREDWPFVRPSAGGSRCA
jgi:competence protein ComEC